MLPLLLLAIAVQIPEQSTLGTAPDDSEDIRILIGRGEGELSLRGAGLQLETGQRWEQLDASWVRLSCQSGGLRLSGGSGSARDLPESASVRSVGPLRVEERDLRGAVELRCQGHRWLAINVLPLEEYLAAVLGGEMPPTFPREALEAQAVAARSYAVHRKVEAVQEGLPYHLDSTVLSQVYGGLAGEDPRTRSAVAATRGEVLADGMLPVEAYFHASCGGQTESGAAALGRDEPYLASVPCPCAGRSPYAHWSVRMTPGELARLAPHLLGSGDLTDLRISGRTASGRARALAAQTTAGSRTLSAVRLRAAVGYVRLPSLWFDVRKANGAFVFEGKGAGHGAGLCQWGARILAQQGKSYREILAHYYPGAELRKIY
ncbi:MAG: SpoIID/LytB domain-containing protein [Myxococcales bacterium]